MPIYAYRCTSCGFAKDVLQKMSDAPLQVCPSCGQATFTKQVTAAGFQLKGSGWYVTDFRDNNKASASAGSAKTESAPAKDAGAETAGSSASDSKPSASGSEGAASSATPSTSSSATGTPSAS